MRFFKQHSIQTIFSFAFILQVLFPVGFISYLSWRNSEQSTEQLATQLMQRTSDRVIAQLNYSMLDAHVVLKNSLNALQNGYIQTNQLASWRPYLFGQIKLSEQIAYVYFGKPNGEHVEVAHMTHIQPSEYRYRIIPPNQIGQTQFYQLHSTTGAIAKRLPSESYDPRLRPWYQVGQRTEQPTWTTVYQFEENPQVFGVSLVKSYYDPLNQFQGVMAVDYTLLNLNQILYELNDLRSGQVFLMEGDGTLIATSSKQQPYDSQLRRIKANQLEHPMLRATAQNLQKRLQQTKDDKATQNLKVQLDHQIYYARSVRLDNEPGLDWWVVVVIPESDLMGEIWQQRRNTAFLSLLATGIALATSYWISRWITRPIVRLSQVTQGIAAGDFTTPIQICSSREVNQLAASFSYMRDELQKNHAELETQARVLEEKVDARSHELQQEISARKQTNLRLENLLNQLQATQDQLVRSAKLATLGELLAAVAYEMNTPLNQIQCVATKLAKDLPQDFEQLPLLVQQLPEHLHPLLFQLIKRALETQQTATQVVELASEQTSISQVGLLESDIPTTQSQTSATEQLPMKLPIGNIQTDIQTGQNMVQKLTSWGVTTMELPTFIPLLKSPQGSQIIEIIDNLSACVRQVSTIDSATNSAAKVVLALRSYSRSSDQAMVEVNIIDNIETAITLYNYLIKHNITLNRLYQPVPQILASPDELAQVWTNLIQNALYAMNQSGTLTIQVFNQIQSQSIQVKISDTGTGIPSAIQNRVFEPFFTTKLAAGEGNGLGLSIVKRIIDRHQGDVSLMSQPGWTEVTITLPYSPNYSISTS